MKKTILFALLLFIGVGAMAQKKSIQISQADFIAKVYDYQKDGDFKYKGDKPAIIDFYADWCGPCRRISPILEKIAKEYDGKLYVYKVDVDKNQALAKAFGVRGIPMVMFIPMKGDLQKAVGARSESSYYEAVKDILKVQ